MGPLFSGCSGIWSTTTKVKTAASAKSDKGHQDGLLWRHGLAPCHGGQVSVAVVQANFLLEDHCLLKSARLAGTLVGVFDGHGGPEAARFACDHLLPYLQKASLDQQGVTMDAIRKAFQDTEEGFLTVVSQHWETKPSIATVGTCCLVGVVQRGTLFVANLGSSRAVLGNLLPTGQIAAEQLSNEHDVSREAIRHEVKAQHPEDPDVVVLKHNVWRVKGMLQISRSIGDAYLKHAKYNSERIHRKFRLSQRISKPLLSADPDIICRKLQPGDRFVIFASDGLWEYLSNEEAVKIVHSHQPAGSATRLVKAALKAAARKREMRYSHLTKIDRGVRRHFHDDITVIVLFIDDNLSVKDSAQGLELSIRYPPLISPSLTNLL
jgi:pyruvate dehydrogenase phosphatase